jgi:two-component system, OmpR family, sensor kinase
VPLRLKLLIATILLVLVGLAVADVVTYSSLRSFLFQRVDQQLVASEGLVLHKIQEEGGPFPGPGGPNSSVPVGTYGELRDSGGNVIGEPARYSYGGPTNPDPALPPSSRTGAATEPKVFTTGSVGGSSLRYRVRIDPVFNQQGGRGTLIVAVPLREVDQTMGRLRLIEALVSVGVLLGLGLISWWLVRRGLRPLEEMGVTAGAIAAGDLSRRVPEEDPRTEVGQLGLALNAMLAQIEAAFEERRASEARLRRFVADASHELRTPLTSIRGYAELFRRGADSRPEDLAKSMRRIEAEAARMGILVDDLLLLARLDQGRPLEREPVDLGLVARDAAESARAIDRDREITVEVDGSPSVLGDEGRLRQVVDNLLDNARVHTPPGSPVDVRVERRGDDVLLSVRDQGPGLPPEVAARVFERFYRGDPARSRVTGAAGLGLSIVAAIVEAHGGAVSVSTPDGSGAVFEVKLPALQDRPPDPDEEAGREAASVDPQEGSSQGDLPAATDPTPVQPTDPTLAGARAGERSDGTPDRTPAPES